jgi:hypothetical protein
VGREAADRVLANGLTRASRSSSKAEARRRRGGIEATAEPEADSAAEGEEVAAE